ncbi:MAG: DUF5320 domain-containing protein [Candidatus Omnitrophica bacterium]|nr:DUF5320 domain-containing protein [Candidatus Omnitrophota bacterium]
MPGGDRTGPTGMGPMTGRAAGYCASYAGPGYANPVVGRRFGLGLGWGWGRGRGGGFGRGFGRGWGAYAYAAPYYPAELSPTREAEVLRDQAKTMQQEIDAINRRIQELESSQSSENK